MQVKHKILIAIAIITFIIFTATTIFIFTSAGYAKADQMVVYLHSDLAQWHIDTNVEYRKWEREVDKAEATLRSYQIPGFICGGLALLSLGGTIVMYNRFRDYCC